MLTDVAIKKAKAAAKPYRLVDGRGLFLFVSTAGGKSWRYRYEFGGAEKTLTLGKYPAVTLADARSARDVARRLLDEGRDPGVAKKVTKAAGLVASATTFESIAREWYDVNASRWVDRHAADVIESLERDAFPTLGALPLGDITAPVVLGVLREIEARPAIETARRVRQRISAVFQYAAASGRAEADPAAVVKGALAPLVKGRQPAVETVEEARDVLKRVEEAAASPVTKLAHRFLALTAVRPGVVNGLPWAEVDAAKDGVWRIPAARMKLKAEAKTDARADHLVPLAPQARNVLEAVRSLTGRGPFVFPNDRFAHRPMSENAMSFLLKREGFAGLHVPHGWRATFSTVMNERFPADRAVIDLMLAHVPANRVEGAYNRAAHLARRKELAQAWADLLLDGFPPAAALLSGRRR